MTSFTARPSAGNFRKQFFVYTLSIDLHWKTISCRGVRILSALLITKRFIIGSQLLDVVSMYGTPLFQRRCSRLIPTRHEKISSAGSADRAGCCTLRPTNAGSAACLLFDLRLLCFFRLLQRASRACFGGPVLFDTCYKKEDESGSPLA